jgi:hypothetical protein
MPMRAGRSRSRRPAFLGVLVASAVLFSACGGSGFVYVGSSADKTFFKVPNDWTAYNKQEVLVALGLSLSPDTESSYHFLVAYDSDPNPAIDHVLNAGVRYPVVLASVRKLDFLDHDTYSLSRIRNETYPVDNLVQAHRAEILTYKDISLSGGVHGSETIFNISLGDFTLLQANAVARVAQIGLLDPGTNILYFFEVKCLAECFQLNQNLIDQILSSWTIKER